MAGETPITLIGNLTTDTELRFTPSGHAVASFTVASTARTHDRQTGEWRDSGPLFLTCTVWRQYAENIAESLTKGMRVIVNGTLKARSFEARDGSKRTVYEIDVNEVGPALRYATAKVTRTTNGTPTRAQQATPATWGQAATASDVDPWAQQQTTDEPAF